MPKLFQKRNGTWSEILSVFQKQGGTWTEILNIFQKIGGTWTKVFAAAKVPGNTIAPTITGNGRLYGTLTNNSLGTWTNTPTGYTRQWRRGNPTAGGGEPQGYSSISGATSSTYVTTDLDDGKYIVCQVTASNALGSNSAASNSIYVNKFEPVALGLYSLSGPSTLGSTLTALEQIGTTWKSTTNVSGDTSPNTFEFEWSYSDGTIRQSTAFNSINSNTYTIVSGDLGKVIRVRVTGTNTGGTATTGYTSSATINTVYSFNFGNTLYVGSNGHIGLDSGSSSFSSMSSGRNIAVLVKDLQQYYLAEYSDNSTYHLYYRGYLYNTSASAANAVDYQIKFYNNPNINYCDVYMVRVGINVTLPNVDRGYYASGNTQYSGQDGGSFFIGTGSVFRVYFDSTPAKTTGVSWTTVNDSAWDVIQTWAYPPGADDIFTPVVSAANQQAPILTAPTLNSVTVSNQGGSVSANFTGGSGPFYQIFWYGTATAPTGAVTPDATGSFSPVTDTTGPSTTSTFYMYVRSVASQFDTSLGPSTTASAWSNGVSFNMISTDVAQNSVPTVRATNTFSTSIVKYLDSITWSSGTYTNAASVSSVLLYSTVSGNLVAGQTGNNLSSFRTANPYAISTVDPAGTPYIFAVRDTVVGTNGTTYYFFSSQITSANADAVAFSYGGSTSAAGGWTASVNSGSQASASYSFVSATAGSGTVDASTGAITASGLGSNAPSTITVNKNVPGYNTAQASAAGTSAVAATFTITYNGNGATGGSTTATTGNGSVVLRANGFTRTNCTFQGWSTSSTGGVTNAAGTSFNLTANTNLWAVWAANANSATAPTGFAFAGNNRPTTGRKQWTWTGTGTVTGGVRTGFRVQISSSSSTGPWSTAAGSPLATSARSYDIAVSPVTSPRWLRIASEYTDGLGVTRVGDFTTGL